MADRLVIDASVAAKGFLDDEQDVDLAEEILLEFLAGTIEFQRPSTTCFTSTLLNSWIVSGVRLTTRY